MKKHILFLLLPFLVIAAFPVSADQFAYKHKAGDKYRIISTVNEDVYIDRRLSHKAEIINRIAVDVVAVVNNKGGHKAVFQTAEKATGTAAGRGFQWSREYQSEFDRNPQGYLDIDAKYFMPVVRNVPVFPDKDLKPGETWTAEGHEMHDFRDSFGIAEPYRIPFTANYTFLGTREWKGKTYPAFSVSYRIFAEPAAVQGRTWPRRILGSSDQTVYWDSDLGQAAAYEEHFRMVFDLSDGRIVEYRGRANAEIVEAPAMDKEKIASEIANEIAQIPDATVRVVDEGVTISLENIQFEPDSAVLRQSERGKLDRIASILSRYPERDILVGGHTALAGTAEMRSQLSAERAGAVAEYLISKKVRAADRVVVQGYGAERPLGDNRTEAGRQRNRRVEITILEN
ncbi:OmpA family protein [Leadbettera azotonutricia]|uniref:OmpA family protein n=1 Tax=Leadbettera azotonutricia (strain ATCC BAA-888 / DSM 13862 / ZAS-9) TaxID=545695 RepID=F5Y914_LEAAZ|nr:OmpA family protein [Leadbettera azotonutricia]AEF83398.1 OmpA family protein [Leadbettera azotonutricia ZAS-9]